jgi:hypothetical protein
MAAGAILPLSILTQLRIFGPEWRPLAIAIYASSTTMGPQLAACIDVWSVERYGWTAILWASLAPGLVSLVTGLFGLRREPIRWRSLIHADLAGVVSLSAGLGLFACGVSQGDRLRWYIRRPLPQSSVTSSTPTQTRCAYIYRLFTSSRLQPAATHPFSRYLTPSLILAGFCLQVAYSPS